MNILAHLYLSGDNEKIILGNFIGDYVKGKKIFDYPENVTKGIKIHREIDHFTDSHPHVKLVNSFYRDRYNKYAGIVTDVVFDYFLSNNWKLFCHLDYDSFIKSRHKKLNNQIRYFPGPVLEFYPFFIANNWLKQYQSLDGIAGVLCGMSKRTSLPAEYNFVIEQTIKNRSEITTLFIEFFIELKQHIISTFEIDIDCTKE